MYSYYLITVKDLTAAVNASYTWLIIVNFNCGFYTTIHAAQEFANYIIIIHHS